jgi:hypothetical protein
MCVCVCVCVCVCEENMGQGEIVTRYNIWFEKNNGMLD